MGMILKVSSQIRNRRVKEIAYSILKNTPLFLVHFTLFWVATLKSILYWGVQKLKQIRIRRPFHSRENSENPNDTFEGKGVCIIPNEIKDEKIDSDIGKKPIHDTEVNTDIFSGFKKAEERDIFVSSSTEEKIAESETCEEIRDEASESESCKRKEISNQSVVREDFIEESHTDYLKNFSLYSVLFLPTISIQFYLSVLLLIFYAYRKKLFAKYLGNENELNRVEETERTAQSENCEENTDRKMPLDGGAQQEINENYHEKSGESIITNESLSNVHETGTLMNVIIPDNDLGKVETQNIINESVESKIMKDVACEVYTLDNSEEIKPGTENEEMTSILAQQENQISINNDEFLVRNEIRNSIPISDKDSKEDSKDKPSKAESNKLVVSEIIPNETEQISVSERKGSKSTSCLVDENKKEIQSENPKMNEETINTESNEEVCFHDILDARSLKEAETFKADEEKYSTNNVREGSNQRSKKTCFVKIQEYNSNGLIPSLSKEMGETENTKNNTKEVQNKELSVGDYDYDEEAVSHKAFECLENSRKNEQFIDSVEKETLSSEKFVDEVSSATSNSLKLIYGPLIFQTNIDDGSKFAFKFRSEVKNWEINKKANRSCEISFKKL